MQETRRRILDLLTDGPVSGPSMAEQLGISRAAVWKHIEALRESGFEIESRGDGYVLITVPEFGGEAVEYGLSVPYEIEYHESIESTNVRARELAGQGRSNIAVLADEQTSSRGRLDRVWNSPSGGVWLSLVCRPEIPPAHAPIYTLTAAVSVTEALSEFGVTAEIKWPNDILIDGKKLVGILTEMEGEADRISWIVVGIGINANIDAEGVPETATTIRELVGDIDRAALTRELLEQFERYRDDPESVLSMWRESSATLGRRVRVETPEGEIVGNAVDIEAPGTLIVETETGIKRITTGDCEHLRPV